MNAPSSAPEHPRSGLSTSESGAADDRAEEGEAPSAPYLVLYDGVCGLCNRSVQFILKRDPRARFHFMPLQSAEAAALLERHGVELDYDSFILVEQPQTGREQLFTKSKAALRVARGLGGWMRVAGALFRWVPRSVGDWLYDQVATRRYRWFGKADACLLPSPAERARFVGLGSVPSPARAPDAA